MAQHSTVERFAELQRVNKNLLNEVTQLNQELAHIAEEREAAAAAEKKRLAERVKRRPERNRAFKVKCPTAYHTSSQPVTTASGQC